ncbi:MAG: TetR/AcrR family transcriptional regulator [Frankia sp.]|nr:TetR/AcrR family transcriptional regulator [Frankia sp.]
MEPARETACTQPRPARRAAWSGRAPADQPESARERIIEATLACIRRHGIERASISAIATIAGVSRPTVYAYFPSREELLATALERAGATTAERVVAAARRRAKTAGDFAVEALVAARREFLADPALNPLARPPLDPWPVSQALSEQSLEIARRILEPIVTFEPALQCRLDEISETLVRWLLSLLMYESDRTSSDAKLRAYLRRVVVPALAPPPVSPAPDGGSGEPAAAGIEQAPR